jgi:hypothetical protein
MRRNSIHVLITAALLAAAPLAQAGRGECTNNDKRVPEQTRACRDGYVRVCEDGQWRNTGAKCSTRSSFVPEPGEGARRLAERLSMRRST